MNEILKRCSEGTLSIFMCSHFFYVCRKYSHKLCRCLCCFQIQRGVLTGAFVHFAPFVFHDKSFHLLHCTITLRVFNPNNVLIRIFSSSIVNKWLPVCSRMEARVGGESRGEHEQGFLRNCFSFKRRPVNKEPPVCRLLQKIQVFLHTCDRSHKPNISSSS